VLGNFKANLSYNNFLLLVYALLLKWPIYLRPQLPQTTTTDAYFYKLIIQALEITGKNIPILFSVVVVLLIFIQAVTLNQIVIQQKLFPKPNYLAGMSYVLIGSLFTSWYALSAEMISVTILIFIIGMLCKLPNIPSAKKALFNIGLFLGVAVLIYFPSIIFILVVLMSISITRPFRLAEWIIFILGMIAPYYFLCAICYLFNSAAYKSFHIAGVHLPMLHLTVYEIIALSMVLITAIIGFILIQSNRRRLLVQSRKSWQILFLFLLISLILPFLNFKPGFEYFFPLVTSCAVLSAGAYHYPTRSWFSNFSHWSLVALSITIGYFFIHH
jgi:hypothetical protein